MKPSYEQYKNYRIYRGLTTPELINNIIVLKTCAYDTIVNNSMKLYGMSTKLLGKYVTNKALLHTYGKKFVAGVDAESLRRTITQVNAQGMCVVVYYLAEAVEGQIFDEKVITE